VMPMVSEATVWGELVFRCHLHDELELRARATHEAMLCDSHDSGVYVLATNADV
jgi:hypothetical protein